MESFDRIESLIHSGIWDPMDDSIIFTDPYEILSTWDDNTVSTDPYEDPYETLKKTLLLLISMKF